MFNSETLKKLDRGYFCVIIANDSDVTIQSKNTGHFWYLHNIPRADNEACVIFHKHKGAHPYHLHGKAGSIAQAIRKIKKHDKWQMNGRK